MTQRFEILETPIRGLMVLQRRPAADERGRLERMFCARELGPLLSGSSIVQVNHTITAKAGTVRGMHFQHPPHAELKLVTCLRGEVFDVAVDLRRGSPTLLRWHAEILRSGDRRTLLIPEGFAHGFQALSDDCELLYFHTAAYEPGAEDGLHPEDPLLSIRWPRAVSALSPRDAAHRILGPGFRGIAP
jgi:dTDP-4-dehydrorhamnose 3,5-epimerase